MSENNEPKSKVYSILGSFSTAMVVTHGPDGRHVARPMHVAEVAPNTGEVCFLTGQGGLQEDLRNDSSVLLVFENDNSAYLSLRGRAKLGQDRTRIKALWKEAYKVWFPKGPDDPEITLLVVSLIDAEYWDNRGLNKLSYLFEAAKAYAKGVRPEAGGVEQHARTAL